MCVSHFKIYATCTRICIDNDYFEIPPINLFIFAFIAQILSIFHFIFGPTKHGTVFYFYSILTFF